MKLTIYIDDDAFVYYILRFMRRNWRSFIDEDRAKLIDKEFNINSIASLRAIFKHLGVSHPKKSMYIIYTRHNYNTLINMIDYGNRSVRGCYAVHKLFEFIQQNILLIYNEWRGYSVY